MELTLTRQFAVKDATIGTLTVDGKFQCFTLEDVIRANGVKVFGETAIPAGTYPVVLCESPRFSDKYETKGLGRIVPLIDRVPGFQGIRIHVGNVAEHSHGCVLVGQWRDRTEAKIVESTQAFKDLMKVLNGGKSSEIRITIKNEVGKQEDKLRHTSRPLYDGLFSFRSVCVPP